MFGISVESGANQPRTNQRQQTAALQNKKIRQKRIGFQRQNANHETRKTTKKKEKQKQGGGEREKEKELPTQSTQSANIDDK